MFLGYWVCSSSFLSGKSHDVNREAKIKLRSAHMLLGGQVTQIRTPTVVGLFGPGHILDPRGSQQPWKPPSPSNPKTDPPPHCNTMKLNATQPAGAAPSWCRWGPNANHRPLQPQAKKGTRSVPAGPISTPQRRGAGSGFVG